MSLTTIVHTGFISQANLEKFIPGPLNQPGFDVLSLALTVNPGEDFKGQVYPITPETTGLSNDTIAGFEPISFTVTMTHPRIHRSLTVFHTVFFYPVEQIGAIPELPIPPNFLNIPPFFINTCVDSGPIPGNRVCGTAPGFCCRKSWEDWQSPLLSIIGKGEFIRMRQFGTTLIPKTYGEDFKYKQGFSCLTFKAEQDVDPTLLDFGDCSILEECDGRGPDSSEGLQFTGFEIGDPIVFFDVVIVLTQGDNPPLVIELEYPRNVSFNTATTPFYNGNLAIQIDIVSTFPLLDAPRRLENFIYYLPTLPLNNSWVTLQPQQHAMLVPREEVTQDGTECDKVGVSARTWLRERAKCFKNSLPGDCLHDQLFQKYNLGFDRFGNHPYRIVGNIALEETLSSEFVDEVFQLVERVAEVQNTLIVMILPVGNLTVIQLSSKGLIVQSLSSDLSQGRTAKLFITIRNDGDTNRAGYQVEIKCPDLSLLQSIPAQSHSLNPQQEFTLVFEVFAVQNIEATHLCDVTMKLSSDQSVQDTMTVAFDQVLSIGVRAEDRFQPNLGTTLAADFSVTCGCNGDGSAGDVLCQKSCWQFGTATGVIIFAGLVVVLSFLACFTCVCIVRNRKQ